MMQMNVRDTVPGFDAMLRGIDLEKLMDERFDGFDHVGLVEKQKKRVAAFRQAIIMRDFDELILELGAKWREKERLRREGISVTKRAKSQAKEYDFPDELIQIALRSLDAHDKVRKVRV
jgi:hypothetical protein